MAVSYDYYPGRKVVCVRDAWQCGTLTIDCPKKDQVYTIRGMRTGSRVQLGLLFYEITNPLVLCYTDYFEPAFDSRYFRPLDDRATDISVFEALLYPQAREFLRILGEEGVRWL